MKKLIFLVVLLLIAVGIYFWLFSLPSVPNKEINFSQESIARGEYLVHVAGCISCHVDQSGESEALVGGLDLPSPFGTFYAPNITPDAKTGIGGWTAEDFFLALRHGRKASGGSFLPAFPYRTYGGMTDQDVLDIAAYIMSQPPVEFEPPQHDMPFWLMPSLAMPFWNKLADLTEGELPEINESDPVLVRGAYLSRQLGHCGECHTPRNGIGIADLSREYAGGTVGDKKYPAINAGALAKWTSDDFYSLITIGILPDGDFVGGHMSDVIEYNTSPMTDEDVDAMVKFFMRDRK